MLNFFGIGRSKTPVKAEPTQSAFPDTLQHTNTQRELIRVVLKDTLRLHGIPPGLIGCEVMASARRAPTEPLIVYFVVMKWHSLLLQYAPVLQQELVKNLRRFDPTINPAGYVFSWRFAVDCECPFDKMPAPDSWLPKKESVPLGPVAAPMPQVAKPKFDLPPSERDSMPSDFAPTQINHMD